MPRTHVSLPSTGSRYDDLIRFIYWGLAMIVSWLEATLVLSIVCYPLALAWAFLRPAPAGGGPWKRALTSSAVGIFIGGAATILVWGMFAWW